MVLAYMYMLVECAGCTCKTVIPNSASMGSGVRIETKGKPTNQELALNDLA